MISVIIPTVDEAAGLGAVLAAVRAGADAVEILVVDGGSRDATVTLARAADAQVIESPVRQRAAQMNLGATAAAGDVLVFLHADTLLPAGWGGAIATAMTAEPALVGGAFRRRFVPGSWFLRVTCALASVRGRAWGWFLGDQAMFVRRDVFEKLGGFALLRACEDLDFSRRLARTGRTVLLRAVVRSSARRFRSRGAFRQTWADLATTLGYLRARDSFLENEPEPAQR